MPKTKKPPVPKGTAPDGFMKSGLKLIGAKTNQSKVSGRSLIYEMLPTDVDAYFEPFLGSGACLVGKEKQPYEYVSDLNPYVINFFNQMKQDPDALWELIEGMTEYILREHDRTQPYYKYFHFLRDSQEPPDGPYGAVWFYLISKLANNGIFRFNKSGKCNSSWCKQYKGRGFFTRDWYDRVYERIKHVQFRHCRYQDTLDWSEDFGDRGVALLDPPYYEVQTTYNGTAFTARDHYRLCARLQTLKCKWLLTINDHPTVRHIYNLPGIHMREVMINYSCSNTNEGRGKKPELFITNYPVGQ